MTDETADNDPTVIKDPPADLLGESESLDEELEIFDELLEDEEITPEEIEDLFAKNTASFRCLAQILISRSSLLRHPLYHFPPLTDPGLDDAFNYVEPSPVIDDVGCDRYKRLCKEFGIVPIARVLKSLPTEVLDLKYYGLTVKQVRAIMDALGYNKYISEVILQDNWLSPEGVKYISQMLADNNTIQYLNLKECRIKPEGVYHLNEGLVNAIRLAELDLSFNSLGDEGLLMLEPALMENMSILKLNLSHNNLGDEAAMVLARALVVNHYIEDLDLSWNNFYSAQGNKALFLALIDNKSIKALNLAWNGIGTKEAAGPIMKYLKKSESLEYFDISNNRLTTQSLRMIRIGIAKCASLISVNIGNNLITPDEALFVIKAFNTSASLEYMDMENTFVNKDFIPLWKKFTQEGKSIQIGGILSNYQIYGPDTIKLLFQRAKFLALKAKKKKAQKDFGHFILQMPQENVTKQEFQVLIKKFKMKNVQKDPDLVKAIMDKFPAKKQKINLPAMRDSYMSYYPDTALPPPKKKKGKKGKNKKEKKKTEEPAPQEGQPEDMVHVEHDANAEGVTPAVGEQPLIDKQPTTEGQTTTEEQPRTEEQPSAEDQSPTGEQSSAEEKQSPQGHITEESHDQPLKELENPPQQTEEKLSEDRQLSDSQDKQTEKEEPSAAD